MADEFEGPGVGSLLQSAIIASPLAIGAGIGIRDILNQKGTPGVGNTSSAYATASKRIRATVPVVPSLRDHQNFMNGLTSDLGSIRDPKTSKAADLLVQKEILGAQAKQAWHLAYGQIDPLLAKGLPQAAGIMKKGPVAALEEIQGMLHGITGTSRQVAMHKMMGKFRKNLAILSGAEARVAGHRGIPTFMGNPDAVLNRVLAGDPFMSIPKPVTSSNEGYNAFKGLSVESSYWANRSGLGGHTTFRGEGKGGPFTFQMPEVFGQAKGGLGGFVSEGKTGATLRIAPPVRIFSQGLSKVGEVSRSDFLLREFEKSILPRIQTGSLSGPALQNEISRLYRDVIQSQEVINTPTTAYANVRRGAVDVMIQSTDEEIALARLKGEGIQSVRTPTEDELAKIMRTNPDLRGGTSPKSISQGRLATFDVSQLSMTPKAMDWASRPEQAIRDWVPVGEGVQAAHFTKYETPEARALFGADTAPRARTLYINPDQHLQWLRETAKIGDGEALASNNATQLRTWTRDNNMRIQANRARGDLLERWHKGELEAGMALGAEVGTGDLKTIEDSMKISSIELHETRAAGEFYKIGYKETAELPAHAKFFGSLKATMHFQEEGILRTKLGGIGMQDAIDQGYTVIADMDRLKKSRSLHNEQMATALHDAMTTRLSAPSLKGAAQGFLADPVAFMRSKESLAMAGGIYGHEKMLQSLLGVARQSGLGAEDIGMAFGSMPYVQGIRPTQKALRQAGFAPGQMKDILNVMGRGVAGGVGSFQYAGPGYDTMGSIEPRAFLALQGGALGGFGEEMAADISRRLAVTTPEKLAIAGEVERTLQSLVGNVQPSGNILKLADVSASNLQREFKQFVGAGGGTMRFGHGFSDMYVPGAETISTMRPFTTSTGKEVYSDLFNIYEEAAIQGTRLNAPHGTTSISAAEFGEGLDRTIQDLQYHHAPGGKGLGAVERGKVLGSRFLMGVTEPDQGWIGKAPTDLHTVGITEKYASQMFAEMRQSGLYEGQDIAGMEAGLRKGGRVGGFISRHPFIGAYSHQPVGLQLMRGEEAIVALPERVREIRGKALTLGPLVGMAGDKDADHFSVMMLGPREEARALRSIEAADEGFVHAYMNHQVRMGLLKPGKPDAMAATTIEEIIGGAMKLGTTQRYVPKLSIELTRARAAIGNMTTQSRADAQTLLEWLEQTPISAKHLSTKSVLDKELSTSLSSIVSAFKDPDATSLRYAMDQIIGDNEVSRQMLEGGIDLTTQEVASLQEAGVKGIQRRVKGINIDETLSQLMASIKQFNQTDQGREFELMTGRGRNFGMRELPEYLAKISGETPRRGVFSGVATAAIAADNMFARIGAGFKHAAPKLGLGFAASIALSSILSSPASSVGSGGEMTARVNRSPGKAANRMRPQDIHPPSQRLGEPTAPSMLHPTRVLMAPPGQSPQVDIRARGSSIINGPDLASRIRQAVGGYSNVNMNVRNDDSNLNSNAYGNKMF